jgi:hypothetical protein
VRARRTGKVTFVVRALVMVEDVIVVKLFIHTDTYACCVCLVREGSFSTTALVKIAS